MVNPKFAIKTLGCKVNQYEEQVLREKLLKAGFCEAGLKEADVIIVNSCSVTDQADKKTIKLIHRSKRENPYAKIIVTGCFAILDEDIRFLRAIREVYKVIPGQEKNNIVSELAPIFGLPAGTVGDKEEVSGFKGHTRVFLKIQDGCDQRCAYCKVNAIRGKGRSRDEQEILLELRRFLDKGYKEIVLTGVCLGAWTSADKKLDHLLGAICEVPGKFRIRLSSIEPNNVDSKIIDVISSSEKFCRHLHIPLQSGSSAVLKRMNRRYDAQKFYELTENLRKKMPLIGITTDVIAGFPGESEEDHLETKAFLGKVKPSRLHVFGYSDREGAISTGYPDKVRRDVVQSRVNELIELGDELQKKFCYNFVDRDVEVMVEQGSGGVFLEGYSSEYLRVRIKNSEKCTAKNELVTVKVVAVDDSAPCLLASL